MKRIGTVAFIAFITLNSGIFYVLNISSDNDDNNSLLKPYIVDFEKNLPQTSTHYGSYRPYPKDLDVTSKLLSEFIGKDNLTNGQLKSSSVYIEKVGRLGNNILQLSNTIYLSEVMNISTIYIAKGFCMIKKPFITSKGIKVIPVKKIPKGTLVMHREVFGLKLDRYIPERRMYEFSDKILKNIPHVHLSNNDLIIHIRGSDIFNKIPNPYYGQPPLCFYESIINRWKFRKIYILSQDKKNPVIMPLIKKYHANFVKTNLKKTIGYILNSKNLVLSFGTFVPSLLKLVPDDYERRIFRYGNSFVYQTDIWNKFYFTNISNFYRKNILSNNWNNTKEQREIMIDEKCGDEWMISMYTNYTLN